MMSYDADDLTSTERTALAGLTREHLGSAELEDRVVESLRDRGLLDDQSLSWQAPRWWPGVAAVAAGAMLFVTGVVVGRQSTARAGAVSVASARGDTMSVVQLGRALQRAGTEYVALLAMLPSTDTATMAFEVARSTLKAAAEEVLRRVPTDTSAMAVVHAGAGGGTVANRASGTPHFP
jgi:hypothetical protein